MKNEIRHERARTSESILCQYKLIPAFKIRLQVRKYDTSDNRPYIWTHIGAT